MGLILEVRNNFHKKNTLNFLNVLPDNRWNLCHRIRIEYCMNATVNVEFFDWGNFRVFRDIAFFAKISPTQKLNPYDFIKEISVES